MEGWGWVRGKGGGTRPCTEFKGIQRDSKASEWILAGLCLSWWRCQDLSNQRVNGTPK